MPNTYKNKIVVDGTTLIDLTADTVTPSTLIQGYTAHDRSGALITGTASAESTFVVTLSYNDQTEMWEPDCTYAEVSAAYQAGKDIVAAVDWHETDATADSFYQSDNNAFIYCVHYPRGQRFVGAVYVLTSSGLEEDETWEAIWPNFESPSRTYTPTTQQQTETITYDSSQGYNGIQQVSVTVNPIPTNYGLITYNGSSLMVS